MVAVLHMCPPVFLWLVASMHAEKCKKASLSSLLRLLAFVYACAVVLLLSPCFVLVALYLFKIFVDGSSYQASAELVAIFLYCLLR